MKSQNKNQGFTLIELLVVVVLIGILSSIAIPTYTDSIIKSRRADGTAKAMEIAQMQERLFTTTYSYANTTTALGYGVNPVPSEEGHYNVSISVPGGCTTGGVHSCYLITATATGAQTDDEDCAVLYLNARGQKTSEDSDGDASTGCW